MSENFWENWKNPPVKSVNNGSSGYSRRTRSNWVALFFVKFAEVIQDKREKTWKYVKKTYFLIYSRLEDQISGLNEMVYSYINYTHDKHEDSDIWNIERELWRLQNLWVSLMCLRDLFFSQKILTACRYHINIPIAYSKGFLLSIVWW